MTNETNYAVLHFYRSRLINRIDCGTDDSAAISIANEIVSQCYQNGFHQVLVAEFKGEYIVDDIFNKSFYVEPMGVRA